jgi:DNA-binding beta-propeller fold protein YncE
VTAINAVDGAIAGTIDLGGTPEEGAPDGKRHAYICVEDKAQVAVVDCKAMKTTTHYDLGATGGEPAGLSMDSANNVIFVYCRAANSCLVLNAANGNLLATLPTGRGVDAAEFNPQTMESFSSSGDGKLTDGDQGNKPHQFCGRAERNHKVRGKMVDAGFQDGPDLSDHG